MMDLIAYLLLQTSWQLITETKSDKHLFCCDECSVNNTVRAAVIIQFQSLVTFTKILLFLLLVNI